ncbi:DNA polymerase III subunit delta [Buchnera aphidicola (Cinara laricifoliae)]|uniref:DNA polymerase III subunit delta, partial n=2 Tax=Buchnera aphidicola TaxID=9 RepID=A0A451DBN1_9GAMM|nr:DNA polymerase III subunit delta [Buchnera aphidicola (Cinara laricifoliae)]
MIIDTMNLKKYIYKNKILTYIILKSEYIFIKENKRIIFNYFKKKKEPIKQINITIHHNNDWKNIFHQLKQQNLFSTIQLLNITIYDSILSQYLQNYLNKLKYYSNEKNIKIFYFPNLNCINQCSYFFYCYIKNIGVIINNSLSYTKNIHYWIQNTLKKNNINISSSAKKFLLTNSPINIDLFANLIENIVFLYPNTLITLNILYKYFKTIKVFSYYDWIQSIVLAEKNKTINILLKLKIQKYDFNILINSYKTLIYIILFYKKRIIIPNNYINSIKYKKKIMQLSLFSLIRKNNIKIIILALKLLKKIELCIQNNKIEIIWMHLKTLSIILD